MVQQLGDGETDGDTTTGREQSGSRLPLDSTNRVVMIAGSVERP